MRKNYVKQMIKELKCSKAKKKDIKKQFTADIMTALEQGESMKEIMARMGTAKEIAHEFNSSFSEDERNRYKRERRLRIAVMILVVVFIVGTGIYWLLPKYKEIEDSRIFSKEQLLEQTQTVIDLLDAKDYENLQKMASQELKPMLTAEYIEPIKEEYIGNNWGQFQNFGTPYVAEINQKGMTNAVVQVNASYEKLSVTYTLLFDAQGKLTGLYMK